MCALKVNQLFTKARVYRLYFRIINEAYLWLITPTKMYIGVGAKQLISMNLFDIEIEITFIIKIVYD